MKKKLADFLTNLATDDDLAQAFKKDKEGTMRAQGIDKTHISMVVDKDYKQIEDLLGAEYNITYNDIVKAYKK